MNQSNFTFIRESWCEDVEVTLLNARAEQGKYLGGNINPSLDELRLILRARYNKQGAFNHLYVLKPSRRLMRSVSFDLPKLGGDNMRKLERIAIEFTR